MATKAELRDRAAQDLGILRIGQNLHHQHKVRVEAAYDEVFAQLREDGLATWASTGTSPDELTPHIASLMADNCLGTYSVSAERYNRIKLAATVGDREIRKFTAADYASQEEAVDY